MTKNQTIEDNEPWLSDLREHVAKAAKAEYDRDWCIYGAKGDGYKMNEIAEAAGLTRQHVRRILDRMDYIFTGALDSGDFENEGDLWNFIWGAKSWEAFNGPYEVAVVGGYHANNGTIERLAGKLAQIPGFAAELEKNMARDEADATS